MALTLHLDEDTAERLRHQATIEQCSAESVVERSIREYLARNAPDPDMLEIALECSHRNRELLDRLRDT